VSLVFIVVLEDPISVLILVFLLLEGECGPCFVLQLANVVSKYMFDGLMCALLFNVYILVASSCNNNNNNQAF
jgi:hypothetical protein